jgi:hypothetical protein
MSHFQKTKNEVEEFLNFIKSIIKNPDNVAIEPTDKNFYFQSFYGINEDFIIEQISELEISNYSHCLKAKDKTFYGEELWIFGQKLQLDGSNYIEIYIKLLIEYKSSLLCLSYHLPEHDLYYPY